MRLPHLGISYRQLPPDISADLQDALQIAVVPIDKQRNAVLSDLQQTLLEVQKLPDNEEKLRRLGELATNVRHYSETKGPEAVALAGAVEQLRNSTRVKVSEAANALDATTVAESDKLKAVVADEAAAEQKAADDAATKQKAADEATAAQQHAVDEAKRQFEEQQKLIQQERDKLQASADGANQRVTEMMGIYSVVKVSAENNIVYDGGKVDAIKKYIVNYIDLNKISKDQNGSYLDCSAGAIDHKSCKENRLCCSW